MSKTYKPDHMIPSAGPWVTEKEVELVTEACREGWYEKRNMHIDQFIKEFRQYTGLKYLLPVSHCTDAIHLALKALKIGPGDEVIVPDVTWVASACPVDYVGATPVFADIDRNSWCLSAESFEKAITPKTKAVIPVDLYGNMPDWDKILSIARKHKILVVEDAAEAMGSEYKGKKAGTFGDVNVFSFNATKLVCAGQGGMIGTNDEKIYLECKKLYHHGMVDYSGKAFWSVEIGYNYQWTNIQAALALAQLRRIDELLSFKRKAFKWYHDRLGNLPGMQLSSEEKHIKNNFWIVSAILSGNYKMEKEKVMAEFKKANIDSRPLFYPISSMPAYAKYVKGKDMKKINPVSYGISPYGISFPAAFSLTEEQVDYICDVFLNIFKKKR